MKYVISLLLSSALSLSAHAELEVDTSSKSTVIKSFSKKSAATKPAALTRNPTLKEAKFDKHNLLRCWQDGELIMAENGWKYSTDKGTTIMSKGNSSMVAFDYGETFCIYLGD